MTLTYSIDHLSTSVEDVSVEVAAKSEMTLNGTGPDQSGTMASVYTLASGDNAYPSTVTYRSSVVTRRGSTVRQISLTFSTWATKADSVSGLDTKENLIASINLSVPATMTVETADVDDLVGNLFSFLYPSVTTKVRSTAWLQKLLYGVTQVS